MRIGELASRTKLAPSRIRFYEASGLIQAQRLANGYREYLPQTVNMLGIITSAQRAGFTLEEIRKLLPAPDMKGWHHDELLVGLRGKIVEIDTLQKRLKQNKSQLMQIIDQIENRRQDMQCDVNSERVIASLIKPQLFQDNGVTDKRAAARATITGSKKRYSAKLRSVDQSR